MVDLMEYLLIGFGSLLFYSSRKCAQKVVYLLMKLEGMIKKY